MQGEAIRMQSTYLRSPPDLGLALQRDAPARRELGLVDRHLMREAIRGHPQRAECSGLLIVT